MMLMIAFPVLRRGVGNAQRFPRGCGQAAGPKGGPSARCRQAIRRLSMAPAALRRGREQAIIQATNCLKLLDAFRAGQTAAKNKPKASSPKQVTESPAIAELRAKAVLGDSLGPVNTT